MSGRLQSVDAKVLVEFWNLCYLHIAQTSNRYELAEQFVPPYGMLRALYLTSRRPYGTPYHLRTFYNEIPPLPRNNTTGKRQK